MDKINWSSNSYSEFVCNLRIGSCLECVYRVMDVRGKFGEHKRSIRIT